MNQIDIYGDFACPWCFIGLRQLEKTLESRSEDWRLVWRPFMLNPGMPVGGMDRRDYLDRKFGGRERADIIYDRIRRAGEQCGIPFAFDDMVTTPNTYAVHYLAMLANDRPEILRDLLNSIFDALFLQGVNIEDEDWLLECARTYGLTLPEDGHDHDFNAVLQSHNEGQQAGIDSVPVFTAGHRYALAGAQPPEALHALLDVVSQGESST